MVLLSLVLPLTFIRIVRETRSSLSGLERVVHQYREDDD